MTNPYVTETLNFPYDPVWSDIANPHSSVSLPYHPVFTELSEGVKKRAEDMERTFEARRPKGDQHIKVGEEYLKDWLNKFIEVCGYTRQETVNGGCVVWSWTSGTTLANQARSLLAGTDFTLRERWEYIITVFRNLIVQLIQQWHVAWTRISRRFTATWTFSENPCTERIRAISSVDYVRYAHAPVYSGSYNKLLGETREKCYLGAPGDTTSWIDPNFPTLTGTLPALCYKRILQATPEKVYSAIGFYGSSYPIVEADLNATFGDLEYIDPGGYGETYMRTYIVSSGDPKHLIESLGEDPMTYESPLMSLPAPVFPDDMMGNAGRFWNLAGDPSSHFAMPEDGNLNPDNAWRGLYYSSDMSKVYFVESQLYRVHYIGWNPRSLLFTGIIGVAPDVFTGFSSSSEDTVLSTLTEMAEWDRKNYRGEYICTECKSRLYFVAHAHRNRGTQAAEVWGSVTATVQTYANEMPVPFEEFPGEFSATLKCEYSHINEHLFYYGPDEVALTSAVTTVPYRYGAHLHTENTHRLIKSPSSSQMIIEWESDDCLNQMPGGASAWKWYTIHPHWSIVAPENNVTVQAWIDNLGHIIPPWTPVPDGGWNI